jgi:non-specific serine/threonine protein kinase
MFYLEILAAILHRQGLSGWAARVYGMADSASRAGPRRRITERLSESLSAVRAEVRAQFGEQAFARALQEGRRLTAADLLAIPNPSPLVSQAPAKSPIPMEPLTAREMEVLRLLPLELSNPQIAERLVVSRRTVDAHLRSIYGKLGVRSRDAAVRVARENMLLAEGTGEK